MGGDGLRKRTFKTTVYRTYLNTTSAQRGWSEAEKSSVPQWKHREHPLSFQPLVRLPDTVPCHILSYKLWYTAVEIVGQIYRRMHTMVHCRRDCWTDLEKGTHYGTLP
ncbi:hypothetical protein J6590_069644 [Homalodisca vitripennis]|nr:hypothetical protein J6590_069644 [Homalodisca vitripennis]